MKPYYSQNDEEKYIVEFFNGKLGNFLDIGAHDGYWLSNTRRLFELGWGGVFIEPSPSVFPNLQERYAVQKRVDCINMALVPQEFGKTAMKFYDAFGDGVGSLVKGNPEKYGITPQEVWVNTQPIKEFFLQYGDLFDFISLDTEQMNISLLKEIPFETLNRLKLICVEYDGKNQEVLDILTPFGFKLIHTTPENMVLGR